MEQTVDNTPRWFDANFQEFLAYAETLRDVCFTAVAGFRRIIEYPYPSGVVLHGFKHYWGHAPAEIGQRYAEDYRIAADEEKERHYTLLFGTFAASAWDSLDYFINDFLADWLLNEPLSRSSPAVAKAAARKAV